MFRYLLILMLYTFSSLSAQGGFNIPEVLVEGGLLHMGCTQEQEIDCYENEQPVRQVRVENFLYKCPRSHTRALASSDGNLPQ